MFRNFYECPRCQTKWADEWSCKCNDQCPACKLKDIEPKDSEEFEHDDEGSDIKLTVEAERAEAVRLVNAALAAQRAFWDALSELESVTGYVGNAEEVCGQFNAGSSAPITEAELDAFLENLKQE